MQGYIYGTRHKCYACACASAADGNINRIALALEAAGIACNVEQTGGFTMVVYVYGEGASAVNDPINGARAISLTDESMGAVRWSEESGWESTADLTPGFLREPTGPVMTEAQLAEVAAIVKANLHLIAPF